MGINTVITTRDRVVDNRIINGDFEFWQRGTFTSYTSGVTYQAADRWKWHTNQTGGGVYNSGWDSTIATDLYNGLDNKYNHAINVTTSTTLGASEYAGFAQALEGNMIKDLYGKKVTLSFLIKSSVAGTYYVLFSNELTGGSYRRISLPYTINQADTWERKYITFDMDAVSPTLWNGGDGIGMLVWFCLGTGSTFKGDTGLTDWADSTYLCGSDQVNFVEQTAGNIWRIGEVMFYSAEFGEVDTFQRAGRDRAEELQLCQRYFEKSYHTTIAPGTSGASAFESIRGISGAPYFTVRYKTQKRGVPYVRTYDLVGNVDRVRVNATENIVLTGGINSNDSGFNVTHSTASNEMFFHWTAEAEL